MESAIDTSVQGTLSLNLEWRRVMLKCRQLVQLVDTVVVIKSETKITSLHHILLTSVRLIYLL